jgi:hypothetical protein
MPPRSCSLTCLAVTVFGAALTASLLGACTRDPFDRTRPVQLFNNDFDYQVIIPAATLQTFSVASDGTGRMGLAASTGIHEVKVLESAAGTWSEVATITGAGLNGRLLDIAPGPMGAWWVLASDSGVGMRLFRVGGAGDLSLTLPLYSSASWDSTGAVLTSDLDGRPVAYLVAHGLRLVRATLADTGWVLTEVVDTTGTAYAWDAVTTSDGIEHVVYRTSSAGTNFYRRVDADSIYTVEVYQSSGSLALSPLLGGITYIGGTRSDRSLILWKWEYEGEAESWAAEFLPVDDRNPFSGHLAVAMAADATPYTLFVIYNDSERISVLLGSRSPDFPGINWTSDPVVEDLPWRGIADRRFGFHILLDTMDRPVIFFLSAPADEVDSSLYVAVPRS